MSRNREVFYAIYVDNSNTEEVVIRIKGLADVVEAQEVAENIGELLQSYSPKEVRLQ